MCVCVLAALVGRQKQRQTAQAATKKGEVRQLAYPATATDSSSFAAAAAAAAMHYADVHQVHEYICEYFVYLHMQTAEGTALK